MPQRESRRSDAFNHCLISIAPQGMTLPPAGTTPSRLSALTGANGTQLAPESTPRAHGERIEGGASVGVYR